MQRLVLPTPFAPETNTRPGVSKALWVRSKRRLNPVDDPAGREVDGCEDFRSASFRPASILSGFFGSSEMVMRAATGLGIASACLGPESVTGVGVGFGAVGGSCCPTGCSTFLPVSSGTRTIGLLGGVALDGTQSGVLRDSSPSEAVDCPDGISLSSD